MTPRRLLALYALAWWITAVSYSAQEPINFFDSSLYSGDELDFADFDSPEISVTTRPSSLAEEPGGPCDITPEEILIGLSLINFANLVSNDIYRHTNLPVIRPLLDFPTLQPAYDACDQFTFYGTLFFTQMRPMYLTKEGSSLRTYLSVLSDGEILQALDQIAPGIDAPNIFPLFNNIKLDMRRLGAVLGFTAINNAWRFSVAAPFYYLENNFFLTQQEIDRLKTQAYFSGIKIGNASGTPDLFLRQHLINDKLGLSDIRFMVDYGWRSYHDHVVRLGGQLTVPVSAVMREGIYGNCFNRTAPQPVINLQRLFQLKCLSEDSSNPALQNQAAVDLANLVMSYGVNAIDWLTATAAANPIGQYTASLGIYVQPEFALPRAFTLGLFGEFDYFAPTWQARTVKTIYNAQQIRDTDYTQDPSQALNNLLFLQQQAINVLYPPVIQAYSKQGNVAKGRIWLRKDKSNYTWTFGFDTWFQSAERLETCLAQNQVFSVDLVAAQRPAALQCKLYGIFDTIYRDTHRFGWKVGLRGDYTVYHTGIGGDWLVGIHLVGDF